MEGQHTNMLLLLMCAIMVMAAGQKFCNPLNQYPKDGQCCKKCGPGTRMSSTATCDEPQCVDCRENEYQDKYTTALKCERQPFCDPNKNFEHTVHPNKKIETICKCKLGFHCSSKECITCVPHTVCPPGEGVQRRGSHDHDTVCEACPVGTFSNESSWDAVCQKLTECEKDYHIKEAGTTTYDNVCEEDSRSYAVWIVIVVLFFLLIIAAVCYKVWVRRRNAEGKLKSCFKPCWGEKNEPLREVKIANPTEEESILQSEKPFVSMPEENEDENLVSSDFTHTANGQRVQQDTKSEHVSQEESHSLQQQTGPFSFQCESSFDDRL